MEEVHAASYKLHSIFENHSVLRNAVKRAPYLKRPMIVHEGIVIGGFAGWFESTRTSSPVPCMGYSGDVSSLGVAAFILDSIGQEALLMADEHSVYDALFGKVKTNIQRHKSEVKMPQHVFAAHDLLYSAVKNNAVALADAVSFVSKFSLGRQGQIFRDASERKLDLQTTVRAMIEVGELPAGSPVPKPIKQEKHREHKQASSTQERTTLHDAELSFQQASNQYDRARHLFRIREDKLFTDVADNFKRYHIDQLHLSNGYVYKLIRMYRITPKLLEHFPYGKLKRMHETLPANVLTMFDEAEQAGTLSGNIITLQALRECKAKDLDSILYPLMKKSAQETFVATQRAGSLAGVKRAINQALSKLIKNLQRLPADEKQAVINQTKNALRELGELT